MQGAGVSRYPETFSERSHPAALRRTSRRTSETQFDNAFNLFRSRNTSAAGVFAAAACFFLHGLMAVWYDVQDQGGAVVDLALKLNALAVLAVFLFIAAILLGAF